MYASELLALRAGDVIKVRIYGATGWTPDGRRGQITAVHLPKDPTSQHLDVRFSAVGRAVRIP